MRIGADARVGPNCILKDCTLGAGVAVMANSIIEGATVGAGARIGPFARLRPGADIGADCHIGNFADDQVPFQHDPGDHHHPSPRDRRHDQAPLALTIPLQLLAYHVAVL